MVSDATARRSIRLALKLQEHRAEAAIMERARCVAVIERAQVEWEREARLLRKSKYEADINQRVWLEHRAGAAAELAQRIGNVRSPQAGSEEPKR